LHFTKVIGREGRLKYKIILLLIGIMVPNSNQHPIACLLPSAVSGAIPTLIAYRPLDLRPLLSQNFIDRLYRTKKMVNGLDPFILLMNN
jgi:hypothetical protein